MLNPESSAIPSLEGAPQAADALPESWVLNPVFRKGSSRILNPGSCLQKRLFLNPDS
jgi:hypothetical protein